MASKHRLRIDYLSIELDGRVDFTPSTIHRVVGEFTIHVNNNLLYKEIDFCLVEFAIDLAVWMKQVGKGLTDFRYESVESAEIGLVSFVKSNDRWRVESVHQEYAEETTFTTDEIIESAERFIAKLRIDLLDKFGQHFDKLVEEFTHSGHMRRFWNWIISRWPY